MRAVTVDLLVPHRLHRWVLPLGFLGLVALAAITIALPKNATATFFPIARLVFVVAYLAVAGVGMSRRRRKATVHVDATGLCEGGTTLVARTSIERVVSSRKSNRTTIELRGRTPLALELTSTTDARALLSALDPGRDLARLSFLATTTPTYMVVLAWIGIPVVYAVAGQLIFGPLFTMPALIAYGIPGGVIWLGASWWFIRRRHVTVSMTDVELPRLFSTRDRIISLSELTAVELLDPFTVRLRFASRRSHKLKIYDPALLAELVDSLQQRARVEPRDLVKR